MCTVTCMDVVPKETNTTFVAFISVVSAISLAIGPIQGGIISMRTTWRWVFLLNVPAAFLALVVVYWCVPRGFPYHNNPKSFTQVMIKVTIEESGLSWMRPVIPDDAISCRCCRGGGPVLWLAICLCCLLVNSLLNFVGPRLLLGETYHVEGCRSRRDGARVSVAIYPKPCLVRHAGVSTQQISRM
jgi:MFS family permease